HLRLIMNGGLCMSDFQTYLREQLNNPEFRREYEVLEPEYEAIRAMIGARIAADMGKAEE
ncbi:hypothetical protein ABTK14_20840, partial [Acinetobacter baumannii]